MTERRRRRRRGLRRRLAIVGAWGDCGPTTNCPADLNGDGTVSFADVLIVIGSWGSTAD